MLDTPIEVLVIDDSETYAKSTARLIEKACMVKTQHVTDPHIAKALLKNNPIKVIIFDQKMPMMTGTDLYKELRKIDRQFKAILLTAQADREELVDATHMGFSYIMLKDRDAHSLSINVLDLIFEYNNEKFAISSGEPFYTVHVGGRFSKRLIQYYITSIQTEVDESVDDWHVRDEMRDVIRAGESKEIVEENEISETISFSKSFKNNNAVNWSAQIGLPVRSVQGFQSALSSEMEQHFKEDHEITKKEKNKTTQSISLPVDGEVLYVRYETAHEYKKARVFIRTSFSWLEKEYTDCVILRLPTGAIKRRIFRCYKDGRHEIIDLTSYKTPVTVSA